MVDPVLTLVIAGLAGAAVALLPGNRSLKKGRTRRYESWGKGLVYLLSVMVLLAGIYLVYGWYTADGGDLFTQINMTLFSAMGVALMAGNAWTARKVRKGAGRKVVRKKTVKRRKRVKRAAETDGEGKRKVKRTPRKRTGEKRVKEKTERRTKKVRRKAAPEGPGTGGARASKRAKAAGKGRPAGRAGAKKEKEEEVVEVAEIVDGAEAPGKDECPSCGTPASHHGGGSCPVCGEDLLG